MSRRRSLGRRRPGGVMVGARAERGRNAQSGSPAFRGGPGKSRLALEVALSAAAIGVIYGYDTGVVAGALLFIPREMGLSTAETSSIATTLALGMIIGALAGGRLADRFGRRITMV